MDTMKTELESILQDATVLERKIKALLSNQHISLSDAPYGIASALTRLENFRDDIQNAIDESEEKN